MPISRRDFLKTTSAGVGLSLISPITRNSVTADVADGDAAAMLYDASMCVGCRACQTACKKRSDLSADPDPTGIYEMPQDLDANHWTLIKLYHGDDGLSFVKRQCMHCVEPACVSVCPVGALQKNENGAVTYDGNRCLGCRYCMAACPFSVPKYQWESTHPYIRKCDFCFDRQQAGEIPACVAACPTGALTFGSRRDLVAQAHQRIDASPDRYIHKVYGEEEVGGTSALYLSHVPFTDLGLPELETRSLPEITWFYMKLLPGVILGMGGLMTAIYALTHRKKKGEEA